MIVTAGQVTIPVRAIQSLLVMARRHLRHRTTLTQMMKATDHHRLIILQRQEECQEAHEDREAHRAHQALLGHQDYQELVPSKTNLAARALEAPQDHPDHPDHQDLQDPRIPLIQRLDLLRNRDRQVLTLRKESRQLISLRLMEPLQPLTNG